MTRANPMARILQPFREFVAHEAAGGMLILLAIAAATAVANSPWAEAYSRLWLTPLSLSYGPFILSDPLINWINDGLMVLFFFIVGLEIKRELLVGELSSPRQALFPVLAAVGGMITPALFYLALNPSGQATGGWPVPMATDIAVALGVLTLLGDRIPLSLKVFLASLAIIDDLGAILVIGVVFTDDIRLTALAAAAIIFILLITANRLGIQRSPVYALLGIALWLAVHASGVHATVAGVLTAMAIPARAVINQRQFVSGVRSALNEFIASRRNSPDILNNPESASAIQSMKTHCANAETSLQRMETALHPVVAYIILPLFAFANGGFSLDTESLALAFVTPVGMGITLGLLAGKPLGIIAFTWLGHRLGLATKPEGISWQQIIGAGFLAGIGFTMAVFMVNLALADTVYMVAGKTSVFAASLLAGLIGLTILWRAADGREG